MERHTGGILCERPLKRQNENRVDCDSVLCLMIAGSGDRRGSDSVFKGHNKGKEALDWQFGHLPQGRQVSDIQRLRFESKVTAVNYRVWGPKTEFGSKGTTLEVFNQLSGIIVQTYPKTIYLSASKCLRGQACSLIPRSKSHFQPR
jgi:hypothetical protein